MYVQLSTDGLIMKNLKHKLKISAIAASIITFLATLFNVYQEVAFFELIKIAIVIFFVWFIIIFLLSLLLHLKK